MVPTRLLKILLALAVTGGAAVELRSPHELHAPDALGAAALNQTPPDVPKAVALYLEALRGDIANPYRWADLGGAFELAGELDKARSCFRRALELSGDTPQVWLRDANFHFDLDEPDQALLSAARVLKTVPDFDGVLFGYFDRFGLASNTILAQIGEDRRATRAYAQHLIDARDMDQAGEVWSFALAKGFADLALTNSYVDAMLAAHRYSEARQDWVRFLGSGAGDYPTDNLVFNGGFEREPTGSAFDWRIQQSTDFDTVRENSVVHDGGGALEIRFHGDENVSYANVLQKAYVKPGKYVLEVWIRTEGITTNEGPRIEVFDAAYPQRFEVLTDPFFGSSDWRRVTVEFTVPFDTNLLAIRILRRPSKKFDNKINGSLWMDTVRLTRNTEDR